MAFILPCKFAMAAVLLLVSGNLRGSRGEENNCPIGFSLVATYTNETESTKNCIRLNAEDGQHTFVDCQSKVCGPRNATLACAGGAAVRNFLQDKMGALPMDSTAPGSPFSAHSQRAWVGGYSSTWVATAQWSWVRQEGCDAGQDFQDWAVGQPNEWPEQLTARACMAYSSEMQGAFDAPCYGRAFCACEAGGEVAQEFTSTLQQELNGRFESPGCAGDDFCLQVQINDLHTFAECPQVCANMSGALACIRSQQQQEVLEELQRRTQHFKNDKVWIGYYNKDREHEEWAWTSNCDSTYESWFADEPSVFAGDEERCALADRDHDSQWSNYACSHALPCVCERGATRSAQFTAEVLKGLTNIAYKPAVRTQEEDDVEEEPEAEGGWIVLLVLFLIMVMGCSGGVMCCCLWCTCCPMYGKCGTCGNRGGRERNNVGPQGTQMVVMGLPIQNPFADSRSSEPPGKF